MLPKRGCSRPVLPNLPGQAHRDASRRDDGKQSTASGRDKPPPCPNAILTAVQRCTPEATRRRNEFYEYLRLIVGKATST